MLLTKYWRKDVSSKVDWPRIHDFLAQNRLE